MTNPMAARIEPVMAVLTHPNLSMRTAATGPTIYSTIIWVDNTMEVTKRSVPKVSINSPKNNPAVWLRPKTRTVRHTIELYLIGINWLPTKKPQHKGSCNYDPSPATIRHCGCFKYFFSGSLEESLCTLLKATSLCGSCTNFPRRLYLVSVYVVFQSIKRYILPNILLGATSLHALCFIRDQL